MSEQDIENIVYKVLGSVSGDVVGTLSRSMRKGHDRAKMMKRLGATGISDHHVKKIVDKIVNSASNGDSHKSSSRKRKEVEPEAPPKEKKKSKFSDEKAPEALIPTPSPGQLTNDKIKEMMANAQRMIEERKAQYAPPAAAAPHPPRAAPPMPQVTPQALMNNAMVKMQQANSLQSSIQDRLKALGMGALPIPGAPAIPSLMPQTLPLPKTAPQQRANLIMDEKGRTVDARTGEVVQLSHHNPTLRANIRAKKQEQFRDNLKKGHAPEDISEAKFFDPRMEVKAATRQRRGFRFNEKGKFQQLAARLRTKAQLEKLQGEIAQAAKKTGIASAAKLATIQPKQELLDGQVPEVEWWDAVILTHDAAYPETVEESTVTGVTNLVEHPISLKPPAENTNPIEIPVYLTKKERKKLRRQNRAEQLREEQEKIRLGLLLPPEPKVRMTNMMRVLGSEAVQDPTKVEAHVRAQMVARQRKHEETNATRKLTDEQRKEKKARKLQEDTSLGVSVAVYRVRNLANPAKKFKVETNAQQLYMTGFVVIFKDCNVIVVEGGPKQQKKFRRLMLHRIKWGEDPAVGTKRHAKQDDSDDDDDQSKYNSCCLVWEGTVKTRAFTGVTFKSCPTESFAREQFRKHGVQQYWDLAYGGTVLEAAQDDT